jgi:hypothetical protein
MSDDVNGREWPEPDDDAGEQPWSPELSLGDPDAWRGGASPDADAWRGTVHLGDWPEWNAGPEYLMWKRIAEDER